jgi:hypothetical protein
LDWFSTSGDHTIADLLQTDFVSILVEAKCAPANAKQHFNLSLMQIWHDPIMEVTGDCRENRE